MSENGREDCVKILGCDAERREVEELSASTTRMNRRKRDGSSSFGLLLKRHSTPSPLSSCLFEVTSPSTEYEDLTSFL